VWKRNKFLVPYGYRTGAFQNGEDDRLQVAESLVSVVGEQRRVAVEDVHLRRLLRGRLNSWPWRISTRASSINSDKLFRFPVFDFDRNHFSVSSVSLTLKGSPLFPFMV